MLNSKSFVNQASDDKLQLASQKNNLKS